MVIGPRGQILPKMACCLMIIRTPYYLSRLGPAGHLTLTVEAVPEHAALCRLSAETLQSQSLGIPTLVELWPIGWF